MTDLMSYLPEYYEDSRETVTIQNAIQPELDMIWKKRDDLLLQLNPNTATWGLAYWEEAFGLPVDETRPFAQRRSRIKAKLRGQCTTTVEMLANVVSSFGYDPSQVSIIEHPEKYQFEVVISDLAKFPSDTTGVMDAINEVKPAHLDWWFTFELAQLLAAMGAGGGFWSIWETTLQQMEE